MMPFFPTKDPFEEVESLLEDPVDYFDFPSSLIAFAESLSSSELFIRNGCFFRKRNNQLTLINFVCSTDELLELLEELKPRYKIKSLNFANKDLKGLELIRYGKEFWVDDSYSFEKRLSGMKAKRRYNRRREIKMGENLFDISPNGVTKAEVKIVFDSWAVAAKDRHFMVVKGHYLRYIERYFKKPRNVHMLSFRYKETGELHGVCGFELYKGQAQITIMKHVIEHNFFPIYFWVKSVEYILDNYQPEKLFCGTTADKLKENLGFESTTSWKVKI